MSLMDPGDLLHAVRSTYGALRFYRDSGRVLRYENDGDPPIEKVVFETTFIRDHMFRFYHRRRLGKSSRWSSNTIEMAGEALRILPPNTTLGSRSDERR